MNILTNLFIKRIMKRIRLLRYGCLPALAAIMMLMSPLTSRAMSISFISGDINMDGEVGIDDVTTLVNYLLKGSSPSVAVAEGWLLTDVNKDGEVAIDDVTTLLNYLLTGDPELPVYDGPPVPPEAEVFTVNGVSFAMIPVEGGTFMMGGSGTQSLAHEVTLSDFSIGQTEVTQELWLAVMGNNPSPWWHFTLLQPVDYVSWDDCQEFIARLNELTGRGFHLPSEAQWEFAARGGNDRLPTRYAGSDDYEEVAWFAWYNGQGILSPVGLKKPNELGLYDMSGNVNEYCQDGYLYHYPAEPQTDPVVDVKYSDGTWRDIVARGGSIYRNYVSVTNRLYVHHGQEGLGYGLRLAL